MRRRKSRGLGDDIKFVTSFTGIDKLTEKISEKLDVDCGCDKRQEKLNQYPSVRDIFKKKGS